MRRPPEVCLGAPLDACRAAFRGNLAAVLRFASMTLILPRPAALAAAVLLGLPVTCSQSGDGIYTGGIQASPASRVNPAEPGFTNDGNHTK